MGIFYINFRCGLLLFYRHTNKDEKVTFIFPDMLVQGGEKPVTTEKPEVLDEAAAQKKRRKVYNGIESLSAKVNSICVCV